MRKFQVGFAVVGLGSAIFGASPARGDSVVVGGSSLLDAGGAGTLAGWLGQGDLTLTRVFAHTSGDGKTSADFHAAADAQGATFSVLQVTSIDGVAANMLIGGYDPASWASLDFYHTAQADAARTAFLFNLTDDTVLREKLGTDPVTGNSGAIQTLNYVGCGPTFGAGADLFVDTTLSTGQSESDSYGPAGALGGSGIVGTPGSGVAKLTYGALEVFTVTSGGVTGPIVPAPGGGQGPVDGPAPTTPLPSTALGGIALLALLGAGEAHRRMSVPAVAE